MRALSKALAPALGLLLAVPSGCARVRPAAPESPAFDRGHGAEPAAVASQPSAGANTEPTISGVGDPPPPPSSAAPNIEEDDPSPVPVVKLTNIGLHVGGGPNDAVTKAPFLHAVERRFDAFKRCYGKIAKANVRGTFGVDLLIEKDGGHPKTSNSRTAMPGDEFRDCVSHVFETVQFDPPKRGATTISYALEFEPSG